MRNIGLYGGSFNPVHLGHTMIASFVRQHYELDEVWLLLSPLNPLKMSANDLVSDIHRMEMLRLACADFDDISPCDIELSMPKPSYTVDTLALLSQNYPDCRFTLIIGGDNWSRFDCWRDYKRIMDNYRIIVYPRPGEHINSCNLPETVSIVHGPQTELSASFIRNEIYNGLDIRAYVDEKVYNYIKRHNLYANLESDNG